MKSLQDNALNFNNSMQFDFNGGNISSDAGLLAVKSFAKALGITSLLESSFAEEKRKMHSDASIIEQLMYSTIAGYPMTMTQTRYARIQYSLPSWRRKLWHPNPPYPVVSMDLQRRV